MEISSTSVNVAGFVNVACFGWIAAKNAWLIDGFLESVGHLISY